MISIVQATIEFNKSLFKLSVLVSPGELTSGWAKRSITSIPLNSRYFNERFEELVIQF